MKYLFFQVGPKPLPVPQGMAEKVFENVLLGLVSVLPIPEANPHWKRRYEKAENWWIEADDDGLPVREIGFSADGEAVVVGPLHRNVGFIVDSNVTFESWATDEKIEGEFERTWDKVKQEMLAENPLSS